MEKNRDPIRVLIADDSLTVRNKLADIINSQPDMAVAAIAADGREAVHLTGQERPDVILMDLVMPKMDGSAAIERIMLKNPTPIIVCSSADNRKEAFQSWNCLKSGALSQIEKNLAATEPKKWERDLVRSIRAAAKLKPHARRAGKKGTEPAPVAALNKRLRGAPYNTVGVGMSTGGPGIMAAICAALPADFPLPILLVIHMTSSLDATFHEWLQGYAMMQVALAENGTRIGTVGGRILVAPPKRHMVIREGVIYLVDTPPIHYCKPSVDALFFSLAQDPSVNPIGVLLSGMGQDGAHGLKSIRESGGYTLCQDEATSVVFGMPRAAIRLDAAIEVLPANTISGRLVALTGKVNGR
ncbi:response regulator [Desulfobulbus rhabdoformis]|uniref:chemotaxis protein CheB n=1 Tax=Desulfobulbus rhabdoformis TaxID=34032 RepID=UPI001965C9BB|nr:chemotaxis protein CheB [Desulfobulbus rhabdoformis]MBM9614124.1 response regulator [Desulfobulbus rhabdoformis]